MEGDSVSPPAMAMRSSSAPQLTKMSAFRTQPKFTFPSRYKAKPMEEVPAANKYDVRNMVDKTSKFSRTSSCTFGSGKRFGRLDFNEYNTGPGSYKVANSMLSPITCGFGTSVRPPITESLGAAKGPPGPGPGRYEVRGKNRRSDPTLSDVSMTVTTRHGWFYDNPEAAKKPGPGTHSGVDSGQKARETREPAYGFGTSNRPDITVHLGVGKNNNGPGQYPLPGTLGGNNINLQKVAAYSFTSAGGRIPKKGGEKDTKPCPDMVPAGTQFGY